MLFTVLVILLYIFHASFRVDGVSISVLTYYVNRLFDYFSKFPKHLISLRLQGIYAGAVKIFSRTFEIALEKISVLHHIVIYEKWCKKRPVFYTKVTIYKSGVIFFPGYPKKQRGPNHFKVRNIPDRACSSVLHREYKYARAAFLPRSAFRPCRPEAC